MTEEKYSDNKIKMHKFLLRDRGENIAVAMLQQLMDENDAIYNDLVYLEVDVSHTMERLNVKEWEKLINLSRSEKYDKK